MRHRVWKRSKKTGQAAAAPSVEPSLTEAKPFVLAAGEGELVPFLNHIFVFKATAETTTGSFSVIEADQHRGGEPPRHVHHREDEAFYVLEGEMTFQVGDETLPAPAGSFVFLPRDLPHSFKVGGNGDARVLHFCAPPGLERFFAEWGDRPFDRPAMGAMAEQFGVEFLPDGREPAQG